MKITSISTKRGDGGNSDLADGTRLSKSHLIFDVIGDLDELNSWLGLVISEIGVKSKYSQQLLMLKKMQQVLYVISAEIAGAKKSNKQIQINQDFLSQIEKLSNYLQENLADGWHQKFLYPGGVKIAAYTDVARTVCRRVERSIVKLSKTQSVRPVVISIINRFSDYLYLLRCYFNQQEKFIETELKFEKKV